MQTVLYNVFAHCLVIHINCFRFWYEREGQFSPDQLLQLQQASLSRLICDNAHNISRVPQDSFVLQPVQRFVPCTSLSSVELGLWRDCSGEPLFPCCA